MLLSELKSKLNKLNTIAFKLPNGNLVPSHFHVTEVGKVSKHFIDCGGVLRQEKKVNFQLWEANDYDHRLHPNKLLGIVELAQDKLNIGDLEIEVEYQGDTIGKYGLDFDGKDFLLTSKQTDCLAKDNCGIPQEKLKSNLSELKNKEEACNPASGCC
ncbi:hypothetical protein J4050_07330 [Winogradskyella sp. DF17]|uniref:Uncharacterized protein n=1 Tax=Winogradskyella pelagia TaxID=2819984 RepID=A0ABS3T1D9_9FLAO|nr:DUF6428 family protein [Winogradskyella sp. DF17]MBO3116552.1 hypothetical protein [Winogradskyella sp. DF17]